MPSKSWLNARIDALYSQLRYETEARMEDFDRLDKTLCRLGENRVVPLPQRDRYLTALLVQPYIGKRIVLKDGDTEIIGACTGINDLYVDKPIFEIDGQLREGIPVRIVE